MQEPLEPELLDEIAFDSFSGGGGTSEGYKMAIGRDIDIAVNHDGPAMAMHRVNHPGTVHILQDVATIDSVGVFRGRPIGMGWMSPDCTDHSKAKGAAPNRSGKNTRGIGWAIVGWVKSLPEWQRPRIMFLENVEEYVDWSPLLPNGKRNPKLKGTIFKQFVAAWRALGYHKIEWRLRRAWWSGSGTIRRRFNMIMRRDDEPIVWPEPTHGDPNVTADAARIAAGELKPWVTVAECLDFSLPIPSIFDSAAEIKRKFGFRAKRPLAHNTLARLAKGVKRRVLDVPMPFLVKVNHTARNEARDRGIDLPSSAMTGKRDDALAAPIVAYAQHGGATRPADAPVHTITASRKDQNAIVVPYLVPRYGERPGQEPRTYPADRPAPTPVPTGNEGSLAAVHMMTMRNSGSPTSDADRPARTIVADGAAPMLVSAYMAQHNTGMVGHDLGKPISTIVGKGINQNLVAASMLTLRGRDRRDASAAEPARTDSAKGNHNAVVSFPLMTVYYGSDDDGASVDQPSRTETAKPRFGLVEAIADVPPFSPEHEARAREVAAFLRAHGCWDGGEFVTVEVDGITFVIVDICMRMLTPRERFTANGFRRDYIIDHGIDENGQRIDFTLEQQGYMCGNAVCPTEAEALIRANYRPRKVARPPNAREAPAPLFEVAA